MSVHWVHWDVPFFTTDDCSSAAPETADVSDIDKTYYVNYKNACEEYSIAYRKKQQVESSIMKPSADLPDVNLAKLDENGDVTGDIVLTQIFAWEKDEDTGEYNKALHTLYSPGDYDDRPVISTSTNDLLIGVDVVALASSLSKVQNSDVCKEPSKHVLVNKTTGVQKEVDVCYLPNSGDLKLIDLSKVQHKNFNNEKTWKSENDEYNSYHPKQYHYFDPPRYLDPPMRTGSFPVGNKGYKIKIVIADHWIG